MPKSKGKSIEHFTEEQKQEIKKIAKGVLMSHLGSLEPKANLESASLHVATEIVKMALDETAKPSIRIKAGELVLEAAGVLERRGSRKFSRKASQAQSHIPVSVNIDQAAKAYLSTLVDATSSKDVSP